MTVYKKNKNIKMKISTRGISRKMEYIYIMIIIIISLEKILSYTSLLEFVPSSHHWRHEPKYPYQTKIQEVYF